MLEQVENTLYGQKPVWVFLFAEAVKKNREVMVVVQLLNLNLTSRELMLADTGAAKAPNEWDHAHLPLQLVAKAGVVNRDREIATFVELAECGRLNHPESRRKKREMRMQKHGHPPGWVETGLTAS